MKTYKSTVRVSPEIPAKEASLSYRELLNAACLPKEERLKLEQAFAQLELEKEALLSSNRQLELKNEERNHFVDIATHDLQLPLAAISMLSETLANRTLEPGSNDERHALEMIYDASVEMKGLINNYLSATQSDTGHLDFFFDQVDFTHLVAESVKRYQALAERKQIVIRNIHPGQIYLNTDKERCRQIIENLLSNAVKYSPSRTTITVSLSRVGSKLLFEVADQGPGIEKDELKLLFRRFQKLSARPTGGELSTGLGLNIVKYLVDQLQAAIEVDSEPGKGATFRVIFDI